MMGGPKEKQLTPEALLGRANLAWSPKPGGKASGALPVLSVHGGVSSIKYTLSSYPHFTDVKSEALGGNPPQSHAADAWKILILMPEALGVCVEGKHLKGTPPWAASR